MVVEGYGDGNRFDGDRSSTATEVQQRQRFNSDRGTTAANKRGCKSSSTAGAAAGVLQYSATLVNPRNPRVLAIFLHPWHKTWLLSDTGESSTQVGYIGLSSSSKEVPELRTRTPSEEFIDGGVESDIEGHIEVRKTSFVLYRQSIIIIIYGIQTRTTAGPTKLAKPSHAIHKSSHFNSLQGVSTSSSAPKSNPLPSKSTITITTPGYQIKKQPPPSKPSTPTVPPPPPPP